MFWSIIGGVIGVVLLGLELLRYLGLQTIKQRLKAKPHSTIFEDNEFTGNRGDLSEAIENAVVLIENKDYLTLLKNYIPEEGKQLFEKDERTMEMFLEGFEASQSEEFLRALKMCQTQNIRMSNQGAKGKCVLHGHSTGRNSRGRKTMTFLKEQGSWRIDG